MAPAQQIIQFPVLVAEEALSCVALGTGRALEEMKKLRNVLSSMY